MVPTFSKIFYLQDNVLLIGIGMKKLMERRWVKAIVYGIIGIVSYPGIALLNKLKISGMENLQSLPKRNVLFVSNHHTYFADVITFLHIFCALKWGRKNKLGFPIYLINPFTRVYYVAAESTMQKNWLSKIFTLAGAITVKRAWAKEGNDKRRGLDPSDTREIARALEDNWVITFPQGTTTPFAPGRKGTAFIIRHHRPIVIPVVIHGFREAFDKKGLRLKKKGTELSVRFGPPLDFQEEETTEGILEKIMHAIGQSAAFRKEGADT